MDVKRTLRELDKSLGDQPFIAGTHLTIADYTVCANLSLLELQDYDFTAWRNVQQWQEKMRELPYYSKAQQGLEDWKAMIKKGGRSSAKSDKSKTDSGKNVDVNKESNNEESNTEKTES